MKEYSFTAASTYPVKLFRNARLMESLQAGVIPPVHVQFNPTNRCNLTCSFCSCQNCDREQEMELEEVERMVQFLVAKGMQAVTITGGGEPLMHEQINEIIDVFRRWNIEVGLVTNGYLLDKLDPRPLTWCRISASDERPFERSTFLRAVKKAPHVDWAFSYVLSSKPDVENLRKFVSFAEECGFTHVRVVNDMISPESVDMDAVRAEITSPIVIWQPRTDSTRGRRECHVSLLRPVIAPDGTVYPCCSVQYAHEIPDLDFPPDMSMGNWSDDWGEFDGSRCATCYYDSYNDALDGMLSYMKHVRFV